MPHSIAVTIELYWCFWERLLLLLLLLLLRVSLKKEKNCIFISIAMHVNVDKTVASITISEFDIAFDHIHCCIPGFLYGNIQLLLSRSSNCVIVKFPFHARAHTDTNRNGQFYCQQQSIWLIESCESKQCTNNGELFLLFRCCCWCWCLFTSFSRSRTRVKFYFYSTVYANIQPGTILSFARSFFSFNFFVHSSFCWS